MNKILDKIRGINLDKYSIAEIICAVLLFVFIITMLVTHSGGTKKSVEAVATPTLKVMDTTNMKKKSAAVAAKTFDFDLAKTDGVIYYCDDNVMNVSEMLIVKLASEEDAKEVKAAVEKRVEDQKNLFKNYAPDQYDLLSESVIETSGNTVFYCTAKNADDVYKAFKKAL